MFQSKKILTPIRVPHPTRRVQFPALGTLIAVIIYDYLYTLLGNIMAGLFMTGKSVDREKYGGILENPPHFPGHVFTCDFSFMKIFRISTRTRPATGTGFSTDRNGTTTTGTGPEPEPDQNIDYFPYRNEPELLKFMQIGR